MNGLWVWPEDEKTQKKVIAQITESEGMMKALIALSKKQEGLTNFELEEAIGENADWAGIWVIRQLLALGLIEFKFTLFGEASRYALTERGKKTLQIIQTRAQPATTITH